MKKSLFALLLVCLFASAFCQPAELNPSNHLQKAKKYESEKQRVHALGE